MTRARLASTGAGNAFLQPLDLHVEPADPLVEFGLENLAVVMVAAAAVAEERLGAIEQLLLPLTDLDGWTWYAFANSAMVLVCWAASKATRALKAAGCRLREPAMRHLGMEQQSSMSITSRAVQFQGSTSFFDGNSPVSGHQFFDGKWHGRG